MSAPYPAPTAGKAAVNQVRMVQGKHWGHYLP